MVVSGSRAEVASSQSSTWVSAASARAIATRCFCPPESWDGVRAPAALEADPLQQLLRPGPPIARTDARELERELDVLGGGPGVQEVEVLEDHADATPGRAQLGGPSAVISWPSTTMRPAVGVSSMFTQRISVLLPAPLVPITPRISPAGTNRSTSSSAVIADGPVAEDLGHAGELNHGRSCRRAFLLSR